KPDAAPREGQAGRLRDRQLRLPRSDRPTGATRLRDLDVRARVAFRGVAAALSPPGRVMTVTKGRALGQHFLRDQTTARAIVDLVAPTERDLVVEIGPGDGALTGLLAGLAGRAIALALARA